MSKTAEAALRALLEPWPPLKRETSDWAREALARSDLLARDRESSFDREGWARCAARGILGANIAKDYGGGGRSLVDTLLMLEGLGHGCADNGLVFAVASQVWSTQAAIQTVGSEEQKRRWLPGLVSGSLIGAFAISEPETGSDTYGLETRAERTGSATYRLNGHKTWLTLAPEADVIVVFATVDPSAGAWGITGFVVDAKAPGVEILGNREKMGMRTTPFGDVRLENVEVSEADRLGPEGGGIGVFSSVMDAERAFIFAGQIGAMERRLEGAIAHAKERKQFGQAIGRFQAVSHRIADMKIRHETARTMMYKVALLSETSRRITLPAAIAKLTASEATLASALDETRNLGARGYVSEFEADRELRDSLSGLFTSGTSDIQRNIIAKMLRVG